MRSFNEFLSTHEDIACRDALFYQKTFQSQSAFEKNYIQLRAQEGRLYEDEVVKKLPDIDSNHPRKAEWLIRKKSAKRLARWLTASQSKNILEVGCGNGWLLKYIQSATTSDCCGIDINETELRQAVRVSQANPKLQFIFGDIETFSFENCRIDCVILASALQYFSDPAKLLDRLLKSIIPGGSIHIVDTPFYSENNVEPAQLRSTQYFHDSGYAEVASHYHHHTWNVLKACDYSILYDPTSWTTKIVRKLTNDSPFPWVIIKRP